MQSRIIFSKIAVVQQKSLELTRCNILTRPYFSVHILGVHKQNTRLNTSLVCAVHYLPCTVLPTEVLSAYNCTCRAVKYWASENVTQDFLLSPSFVNSRQRIWTILSFQPTPEVVHENLPWATTFTVVVNFNSW